MTVHHCPKCELRFSWQTELEDHCRTDHPNFHHDYPVGGMHHEYEADQADADAAPAEAPEPPQEPEIARSRMQRALGRPPERAW